MGNNSYDSGRQSEGGISKWLMGLLIFLDCLLAFGSVYLLEMAYVRTNQIWLYYDYVWMDAFFATILALGLLIVISILEKRNGRLVLSKQLKDYKLELGIVVGVAVAWIAISCFFPVSGKYRVCRIEGENPSKYTYLFALLRDCISQETETVVFDTESVTAGRTTYTIHSRYGSRNGYTDYITYKNDQAHFTAMQVRVAGVNYVRAAVKYKDTIEIEYYVHSGVIKAIDGMNPNDGDALNAAMETLFQQYEQKMAEAEELAEQQRLVEEAIQSEENRQWSVKFRTLSDGVGRQFAELVQEIEDEDVVFDFPVHYISTEQFEVGSLAFYDNIAKVVYVVEDRDGEDMVQVPDLYQDMTLPEIQKALEAAGIRYTYSAMGNEKEESKQKLNTYYCSPGTWIPKDYYYGFSVK